MIGRAATAHGVGDEFNVVKFRTDAPRLSFLAYPHFFDEPHPALEKGVAVDLLTGRTYTTDYRDSLNPPMLHRKELLLESDHPSASEFAALSRAEEAAGLYQQTATIGFRLNWERLLEERGVEHDGSIRLVLCAANHARYAATCKMGTAREFRRPCETSGLYPFCPAPEFTIEDLRRIPLDTTCPSR